MTIEKNKTKEGIIEVQDFMSTFDQQRIKFLKSNNSCCADTNNILATAATVVYVRVYLGNFIIYIRCWPAVCTFYNLCGCHATIYCSRAHTACEMMPFVRGICILFKQVTVGFDHNSHPLHAVCSLHLLQYLYLVLRKQTSPLFSNKKPTVPNRTES